MKRKKDEIDVLMEEVLNMEEQLNITHNEDDVEKLIEDAMKLDNILEEEDEYGS